MKRKKRVWFFVIPLLLILAGAILWYFKPWEPERAVSAVVSQRTAVVRRGNLSVTLSGSGSVNPSASKDIKAEASGTIKENYLEEGRKVKAGDVLLVLNKNDDDISMKKLENALEQKRLAYEKQLRKYEALTVKAPAAGKVTEIMVKQDENVNEGKELVSIIDDSILYTEVTFDNITAEELLNAGHVTVHLPDYMTSVTGDIVSVRQEGKNAEAKILVKNPGELTEGISVWCEAEFGDMMFMSSEGLLKWYVSRTVYAEASGLVQTIHVSKNDYVEEGTVLVTLHDEETGINLENARIQLEEAEYSIEELKTGDEKYIITAPMDGYLVSVKSLNEGDSVKEGDTVATLINTDEMEFTVYIDELDINRIAVGQDVKVTVEAVEETALNPVIGKVTNIALTGNSSGGVTVYPVTITMPGSEKLKVGMNVDGEIQVINKENVLLVPLEALHKVGDSYMVWVKNESGAVLPGFDNFRGENTADTQRGRRDGESDNSGDQQTENRNNAGSQNRMNTRPYGSFRFGGSNGTAGNRNTVRTQRGDSPAGNYYEGAVMVRVEIGDYNENYAEIISGLEEGDTVVLPMQASNTNGISTIRERLNQMPGGFSVPGMPMGGLGGGNFNRSGGVGP